MAEATPAAEVPSPLASAGIASFDEFYVANHRRLLRLAVTLTGSREVAEELAQEAMIRALKHWTRVQAFERPDAWVTRVLCNLATSRGRRLTVEARFLVRLRGERKHAVEPNTDNAMLLDAIRRLPRRQAQAIVLFYFDDESVQSIAVILECPENTVKTLLRRARGALADLLGEIDDEDQP